MNIQKRSLSLDIMKCCACIAVVILHVAGNSNNYINRIIYYLATFAVPVFFVVNGYLMLNKNNITYKYVIRKIFNIVKVVIFWNIIISIVRFSIGKGLNNPLYSSFNNLIQKDYFWQFWFFGALIIIYIFLPILNKAFKNTKSKIYITCIFITISSLIDLSSLIMAINGNEIIQIKFIQTFRLWTWFTYFCLGGILGDKELRDKLKLKIPYKINFKNIGILTILVIGYEYIVSTYIYKIKFAEYFYDNIIIIVWVVSIFYLINSIKCIKPKYLKLINLIGDNLIGIYIIHPTIIRIIYKLYKFDNSIENIVLIVIVFTTSLAISIVLNKIKFIRGFMRI